MSTSKRALILVGALAVIALGLLATGLLRDDTSQPTSAPEEGKIHIYVDDAFVANVLPDDLANLPTASFEDAEEGKTQEGPLLRDLILLYVAADDIQNDSQVTVFSPSGQGDVAKSASLTWAQISTTENHVLLDVNRTGDSLKLVSTLPELDTRAEWVQGVARIDIVIAP